MYVNKWSQDLIYKNNVSKKKEKKRYILSSLHPLNEHMNTPRNKNSPILTFPLRMTILISQNYFPFLSRVTRVRVSSRHLIGRASISISVI